MCFDDYKTLNLLLMSYRSWSGLIYLYILKSAWKTVDRYTGNGRPLLTESLSNFSGNRNGGPPVSARSTAHRTDQTVDRSTDNGRPLITESLSKFSGTGTVDRKSERGQPLTGQDPTVDRRHWERSTATSREEFRNIFLWTVNRYWRNSRPLDSRRSTAGVNWSTAAVAESC